MDFKHQSILLTGGTGSFGGAFIKHLIKTNNIPRQLTVYSRDWQKQKQLRDELGSPVWIKWVLGDIRDKERLKKLNSFDIVIHAAAIKCIDACRLNPTECLETNVIGTQNIIDHVYAAKFILISTDKAVHPINTYGTSKKMAEKLWIAANGCIGSMFSVCRYGNVIGSSGSVLPLYKQMIHDGVKSLPVTHDGMTRFWYPMQSAINFVIESLDKMEGDEVFIPQIPSIRITDLCKALNMPYHIIGIRPGEKLHESMIPPDDVTGSEGYNSGNNPHFLTVEEIRESIKEFV